MHNPAQRAELIEAIRRLPQQIRDLVEPLTAQQLGAHPLPGEWSVAQNVHHLVDSHMNSYIRCKLILTEDRPVLKPYDQELWAMLPDAQATDLSSSLALLDHLHRRWVQFWENLPAQAWQRAGQHPEYGEVTLDSMLQTYAEHGLAHIEQIQHTLAA